jgi:radical SAM protein with 4Fe4S-binding SPASM domain
MISISKLLCDAVAPGDDLRYGEDPKPPIVVWNCTQRCNLRCVHCYARAQDKDYQGELTTEESKSFIRDLAEFGVPVILFSGGEPTLRKDLIELAAWAKELGVRPVLSTNGTLITPQLAQEIAKVGFGEVGISVDGIGAANDRFRGQEGAYEAALSGIRQLKSLGHRVSLRLTITRHNFRELPAIFDLVEREGVDRICFYHLTYAGRASEMQAEDVTHAETRELVDLIMDRTLDLYRRGLDKEVLTVDNHADGVYAYLRALKEIPDRAPAIMDLLRRNGGNNSGIRIAAVDNRGDVHPDQFWWHYSLGNVRQRKFGDIWTDESEPLLQGLRDRKSRLKGRCARCRYLDICNGNLRVRAEAVHGDVWDADPACYLTDEEIAL